MKRSILLFAISAIFVFSFDLAAQHGVHGGGSAAASSTARDSGPLSSATVTFGGWLANTHLCPPPPPPAPPTPPAPCPIVDRFPPGPATQFPRFSNHHQLTPEIAKIKAGGTVNFIIAGLHVISVYDDGTKPEDIDITDLVPNRPPMTPPIINDATDRIYRGLDPLLLPPGTQQDRVEAVQFSEPGLYLVICAVLPHFQEGMYGYVRVLPSGEGVQAKK
jgi:plastocyanin